MGSALEPAGSMLRIYLSGQLGLESTDGRVEPADFPGQQGREVFAFLVMAGGMPVTRTELAGAVWGDSRPPSADAALNSIVSKLRRLLGRVGLDGATTLRSAVGCYELRFLPDTWIDHVVAFDAIHLAEAALRANDIRAAYGPSAIARQIAGRPFLAGSEGEWIENRRIKLRRVLVRALECRAEVYLGNGEFPLAVEVAREATTLEPFRESAYRLLMRAHAAAGNAAEALRVFETCRELIADELGVPPSQETKQAYVRILDGL